MKRRVSKYQIKVFTPLVLIDKSLFGLPSKRVFLRTAFNMVCKSKYWFMKKYFVKRQHNYCV